jgi:hypothetical protein
VGSTAVLIGGFRIALFALLAVASTLATSKVGFLLGWLIGASRSPLAVGIAPLIFGLLAVLGVRAGLKNEFATLGAIWRALFVALLITVFCYYCSNGILWGNISRLEPYHDMAALFGEETWATATPEQAAMLNRFRWKARQAGIAHEEYESFMLDAIRPILRAGGADADQRIDAAIRAMEPMLSGPPNQRPVSLAVPPPAE